MSQPNTESAPATRWLTVRGQSSVTTELSSSVHPIHATSTEVEGSLEGVLDWEGRPELGAPHGARLRLKVESLQSGSRIQDAEMWRRMDTRRNPDIEVIVGRVWERDGGGYRAAFEVRAHGVTRPYEGDFELNVAPDGRVTVDGEHAFDMRDFNVSPPRFLTLKVDPEVKIRVHIVGQKEA
ncbi:MAG: YceI family protein [Candidatus Dormibacteraeota bacterium]|nr:YceI family protein [Candidatus Dormibacteraeota bacterium]